MAVAVEIRVAVAVSVGASVRVAAGAGVALTVGEASGVAAPAQPARQNNINSEHKACRMVSLLLLRRKRIDPVGSIFIHNRE